MLASSPKKPVGGRGLKTIDLFAGCGGLALGLHRAGHSLVFAVEKDPMAFETFRTNFLAPEAPYHVQDLWPTWLPKEPLDIHYFLRDKQALARLQKLSPEIDMICGGPPCQGFSVGGLRDGNDARNDLPQRYVEFVRLVQPKFVLLENVEGMTRAFLSKPGAFETSFIQWVENELDEMGYNAHFRIINAADFGVPQLRRRVFLFGVKKAWCAETGLSPERFFEMLEESRAGFISGLGLKASRSVTVREAIDDLDSAERVTCPDSHKFQAGTYKKASSRYSELLRKGMPDGAIPDSHRFSKHTERILEFYQKVHDSGLWGRLPKEFLRTHGTKKDKKVLIDPNAPASTITTHPDEFIHYRECRNITVREMARIQSFPDDFVFRGRYTINGERRRLDVARCSQVGNAVPPLLAEAIGQVLQEFVRLGDANRKKNHSSRRSRARDLKPAMAI